MAVFTGTANNDALNGTTTNDTLNGLGGTDILNGNGGNDVLNGGTEADIMNGGQGNDIYDVENAGDTVNENALEGTDLVRATISYALTANVENLTLTGAAAINGTGNSLNNTILGNTGVNILSGGGGNDLLNGGTNADTMDGGLGDDVFVVDNAGDVVIEAAGEGTDTVQSSVNYTLGADVEKLTLTGTAVVGTGNILDNVIIGNSANNTLTGDDGADTLNGGAGNDTMVGGIGNDTYVVDKTTDVVTELGGEGTDTVQSSVTYTLGANVENLTLLGTSAINGTGNGDDNTITGNTANNTLNGMVGADTMIGLGGNDLYIVDDAGDVVTEGAAAGIDTVQTGTSYTLGANVENVTLTGVGNINATGNTLVNTIIGNAGDNTLDGGAGADKMTGGLGDDTYIIDNAADGITEATGGGTDTVQASSTYTLATNLENLTLTGVANINGTGNSAVNIITGNTGNNTLSGAAGADTMIGGAGNDTYIVDNALDVITEIGGEGTDSVTASISYTLGANVENLTLGGTALINGTGNTDNNTIIGNSANNVLTGDDGNDFLNGLAGNDTMIGGDGDDTYVVDRATDVVTEAAGEGTDTVQSSVTYTVGAEVENLVLTGTSAINGTGGAGTNTLTGNAVNNILDGAAGADTMIGLAGNDTYVVDDAGDVVTEVALGGLDTVNASITYTLGAEVESLNLTGIGNNDGTGNALANTINGNAGDNTLDGGLGADKLAGGLGNDTYVVDNIADTVTEATGAGTDTVESSVNHTLASNVENLTLTGIANINATGNAAVNTLTGNTGNNTLSGAAGADTMIGGDGNDTYIVDNAGDTVTEAALGGTDSVQSAVTYTLGADVENLTLTGTGTINGTGNADVNTITGNSGNNVLDGAAGADTMVGGLGNDTYVVDDMADVVTEGAAAGTDLVQTDITYTLGANVENLTLTGVSAIDGTGNALANTLTGNTANNTLDGAAGADKLLGGDGDDTYVVDNALDVVTENALEGTADTVNSAVTFALGANVENLTLTGAGVINGTGNADVNIITGNISANTLNGAAGADTMIGGLGNDTYIVDNAADVVTELGSEGTDTVSSTVTYTLGANVENLTLGGASALNGTGNGDANVITGNNSNNVLDGAAGADTLIGGLGNDTYVVDDAGDVVTEAVTAGTDLVQASVTHTLAVNVENLTLTGGTNINATGNAAVNIITGNTGDNVLDGAAGVDTLIGGDGNDTYVVDSTTEVVTELAAQGTDTVNAGVNFTLGANVENLTLTGVANINGTGNADINTITGNSGNNTLNGMAGADTMIGGLGDDTYIVDNALDVVTEAAAAGADTVQASFTYTLGANIESLVLTGVTAIDGTGNADVNTLTGNSANNTLDGAVGADTMIGGLGNDTYIVDNTGDTITENTGEGTDTVSADASYTLGANLENLTLTGVANITGTGNSGVNFITGNDGNNTLDGGTNADAMIGGLGDDTYIVDHAGDVVTEQAGEGTDTVQTAADYTLGANIENLTLTGLATINGTGNGDANVITGNAANNTLNGGAGIDTLIGGIGDDTYVVDDAADVVTEAAGEGADTVQSTVTYTLGANVESLVLAAGAGNIDGTGNTGVNTLTGNEGNNTLDGAAGADTMIGGLGDDTYMADNAGDVATEAAAAGTDTVIANVSFSIAGFVNVENLTLTGAATNATGNINVNTLTGTAGANALNGLGGADTMIGGDGNDTYTVDDSGDTIIENAAEGTDLVQSAASYTLGANIENLTLTLLASVDGTGNADNNTITGNNGNNTLNGMAGADVMIGAGGNDTYVVDNVGDVVTEAAGGGTDAVISQLTYTLGANLESLVLAATFGNINGTGNTLNNTITGNEGNNLLDGAAGADTMIGGDGNDTYAVDSAGDTIVEGAGQLGDVDLVNSIVTYTLAANLENLTLSGANLDGTGNALVNTITGTAGNNILDGAGGADTMIGGLGNDTYVIDDIGDVIVEAGGAGTDNVLSSITFDLNLNGTNVENLTLTGGDSIDAIGNGVVNTLTGNAGNNTLDGGLLADTMAGGLGDDHYVVDNAGDVVTEAAAEGNDTVHAGITYTLAALANLENITLTGATAINATGNASVNILTGNSNTNVLDGGAGADTLAGLGGNDTYTVDNAGDVVIELVASGTDTVNSSVSYTLAANVENLTLTLAANVDATGNGDVNILTGNGGNNTLNGLGGADNMAGGLGNDTFIVDEAGDIVSDTGGTELVMASVSYALVAGIENLTLTGSANINGTGTNAVANTITGNSGDNTLDGGTGTDTLIGGLGNDTYMLDVAADVVTENASEGTDTVLISATYTLAANVENLVLGGVAAINGTGNAENNTLTGNSAVNALNGLAGADTMIGGDGNDTYTVDNAGDVIVEIAGQGATDAVSSSVSYTLSDNVENLTLTGAAVSATGNNDVNVLTGTTNDNTLDGGVGADTMIGLAGNDTYVVDNAGDVVTEAAAAGNDTVNASITYSIAALANVEHITLTGAGNINATGNTGNNSLTGNTGNNSLNGGTGNDTMAGGLGDDNYFVDAVGDVVTELVSEGTDTVQSSITYVLGTNLENLTLLAGAVNATGNGLGNTITGNTSANVIDGGLGADLMMGSTGNDTYVVDDAGDVVSEIAGEGTDLVQSSVSFTLAGTEAENLTRGANINGTGSVVVNTITGNAGDNTLDGGAGADTLIGGTGNDTYVTDNVGDVTTENLGEGTDTVRSSVNWTLAANLENLVLIGVTNINGTGNAAINIITGNDGNNTLDGGALADTMTGGLGDDTYVIDTLSDVLIEAAGEGTDTVSTGLTFTLATNFENLVLTGGGSVNGFGNAVNNSLTGNSGANTLDGGAGADTMIGGTGNDTYVVDELGDIVSEGAGAGTDTVQSAISYTLGVNVENLTLTGASNIDGTGNTLNNVIIGNTGSNVLNGGTGADTLTGGLSDDIFFIENSGDVVTDFTAAQGDAIDIADLLIGYDPFITFLTDYVQITDNGGNSEIRVDADGLANGTNFVLVGTLTGVTGFTDEDLMVTNGNLIVQ